MFQKLDFPNCITIEITNWCKVGAWARDLFFGVKEECLVDEQATAFYDPY